MEGDFLSFCGHMEEAFVLIFYKWVWVTSRIQKERGVHVDTKDVFLANDSSGATWINCSAKPTTVHKHSLE